MAATAAYVSVVCIAKGGVPGDGTSFSNISATTAAFGLLGGEYALSCKASTYGTVTLQTLAVDGVTWLQAAAPFSADGTELCDLPAGLYRVALA